MYRKHRILCIAPCFNEEAKITHVVKRALKTKFVDELLVVDDGSTDNSATLAKALGATVLSLGKVLGVGAALRAGFEYARTRCDIIVVIAGNNKDEPKEMVRLLDPIIEKKAELVQGSRYLAGGAHGGDMPLYRKAATRIHPFIFSLLSVKKITDSTNGFRAFHVDLLTDEKINLNQPWLDQYELEPYLLFKAISLGHSVLEVPVTKIYPPKKLGITKMRPVIDWWSILRPLFLLKLGIKN